VQLTWTPNDTASSLVEAKETDARAQSVRARRSALLDGVRMEVSEGIRSWSDARLAIETSARSLAASLESYRVRRALFLNQRATSVELSDAEADLLRARLDAVNARIDQRIARVRLTHAVGRDVRS
jgi:outer membrane protein TolC